MNRYVAAFSGQRFIELLRLADADWDSLPSGLIGCPVYFHHDKNGAFDVWPLPIEGCKVYKLVEMF